MKSQSFFKKHWLKLFVIAMVSFYLMSISDQIMNFISGDETTITSNIQEETKKNIISEELGYTIKSGQIALTAYHSGESGDRILIDVINGLTAWIPSRLVPSELQFINLYEYNTLLANGRYTLPTDFLSMIIYDLGYIGVIIIPLIFGVIIRIVETVFNRNQKSTYYNLLYGLIAYNLARIIAYADLEIISRGFFYIFVGHLIVKILNRVDFSLSGVNQRIENNIL